MQKLYQIPSQRSIITVRNYINFANSSKNVINELNNIIYPKFFPSNKLLELYNLYKLDSQYLAELKLIEIKNEINSSFEIERVYFFVVI